jgi:RNA polymerase sigma-70 factor (ECF subfamily)
VAQEAERSADATGAFRREALPWIESVRRFARSLCHDLADTEDLVQETYLRAYQSWHTFELGTDCRRWLFTICRNAYRRQRRDARNVVGLRAVAGASMPSPSDGADPEPVDTASEYEGLITRIDIAIALESALPQVPEPYRTTLVMILVEDQTYEAAAAQLDVPVGTVRSRLSRARRLVQHLLIAVAHDAGVVSPSPKPLAHRSDRCRRHQQCSGHGDEKAGARPRDEHRVHPELV